MLLQPERKRHTTINIRIQIYYLSILGGKGNCLEHSSWFHFTIRVLSDLVCVEVIEVGVFFIVKVIKVGYLLFHLRVQIYAHLLFCIPPLIGLHLLVDELSFLHTF